MKEFASIKLTVTKSRFHAHLYAIDSIDELKEIQKAHRHMYKKANHHCVGAVAGGQEYFRDDGEVGKPGRVLLELLKRNGMENHAIVVSRIFGGTKLGVGGVSRAFRQAGEMALEALE